MLLYKKDYDVNVAVLSESDVDFSATDFEVNSKTLLSGEDKATSDKEIVFLSDSAELLSLESF